MREPRPDLANVVRDLSLPRYIGTELIPTTTVTQRTGTAFYADSVGITEQTVQTNRPLGGQTSSVIQGEHSVTFVAAAHSLEDVIDDVLLTTQYNRDLEAAKIIASKRVAKSLAQDIELEIAGTIMGATENAVIDDTSNNIVDSVTSAVDNIQDGDGMVVLAMSKQTRDKLLKDSDFSDKVSLSNSGVQLTQLTTEDFIAQVFGVDEVFIGESAFWGANNPNTSYADHIAVFRKPFSMDDDIMTNVMPATIFSYKNADFDTPYEVYEYYDDRRGSNVIVGYMYYEVKLLNENLISVINNVGA